MIDLTKLPGIGEGLARRIARKWPDSAGLEEVVRTRPYELTQIEGIGFLTADKIAMAGGLQQGSPERIRAAVKHILTEASNSQGHTCLPTSEIEMRTLELIGQRARFDSDEFIVADEFVALRRFYDAEEYVAKRLGPMADIAEWAYEIDIDGLAEDQALALQTLLRQRLFVLLGAAGTGKTTLLKALLRNIEKAQQTYALAAPTGKAAKRMEEATGQRAQTIHRLLEATFDERSNRFYFQRDEHSPLAQDWIIIDEASMIDARLMRSLVSAIEPTSRLLFVGDPWQLPSVGAGDVLRDLTACKGIIPYVTLTKLKRQDPNHLLAANCARIREAKMVEIDNGNAADFFFADVSRPDDIISTIADLVEMRLPVKYGLRHDQIQVLTALRERGRISCVDLNKALRGRLNAAHAKLDTFAPGDRVIQTRNDYKIGVMNGECGSVLKARKYGHVTVKFDTIDEPIEMLTGSLEFAWCLTVHKAQGSEWPWVIVPIHESSGVKIPRQRWIYTAISRGKQGVVLVGNRDELAATIQRSQDLRRWTLLPRFLEKSI